MLSLNAFRVPSVVAAEELGNYNKQYLRYGSDSIHLVYDFCFHDKTLYFASKPS
jgi:hypothetical protein